MNDILFLALSLITGVALGVVFFGGLWWTVRKGTAAKRPALWFAGSLLLRTGGGARRLLFCGTRGLSADGGVPSRLSLGAPDHPAPDGSDGKNTKPPGKGGRP